MARNIDVFGFDELEKAFKRCEKNYPNQADAFLMAEGQAVNKRKQNHLLLSEQRNCATHGGLRRLSSIKAVRYALCVFSQPRRMLI